MSRTTHRRKSVAAAQAEEANQQRLIAAEVISRLYLNSEIDQLRMLEIQVKRAVEMLKEAGAKPRF